MRLRPHLVIACIATYFLSTGSPHHLLAQQSLVAPASQLASIPDAPEPQFHTLTPSPSWPQADVAQESSSAQTPAAEPATEKTQREKAQQQIKEQEHQRVLGILPAFNTSYRGNAVSLTAKEKISLAFRSAVDPVAFGSAFVIAGLHEGLDEDSGFGWGPDGYIKRTGAAYLDAFNGTMIGNGFLPALLHQDPRYFRLGHETTRHRLLYAVSTSVICKHDNTHKLEPNYSNVIGNIASGAISNLYYPSQDSGFEQTISTGMIVTAEGTIGAVFQEFWPDISRKFFHKDPTRGLDAEASAADKATKRAKGNRNEAPAKSNAARRNE